MTQPSREDIESFSIAIDRKPAAMACRHTTEQVTEPCGLSNANKLAIAKSAVRELDSDQTRQTSTGAAVHMASMCAFTIAHRVSCRKDRRDQQAPREERMSNAFIRVCEPTDIGSGLAPSLARTNEAPRRPRLHTP